MKTILMVISDTNIGGAGKWILEYFRHANPDRFLVKAVIPAGSQLKELYCEAGLPVIECEGIADISFHPTGVRNLYRIFRRERPDIVHSHGTMSARLAAKCPFSHVKKVVYTRHSVFEPSGFFTTPIGKLINRVLTALTSDRITVVCKAALKNLVDTGISQKRITVVYNGVEAISPPTPEMRRAARARWGIREDELAFTISARLNPVKGHRYLLEAVHRLKSRDKVKFFLAGTGPEEAALAALIREYNLEDTVIMIGFLSDISSLLYATDVLLNCSYGTEACSLAILEAFSLGIPCIATDYGGNPELVTNGYNGIVYPTNDVEALKGAIETLQKDSSLAAALGNGAKATFDAGFTVQIMAKNIEKVYEELCHE